MVEQATSTPRGSRESGSDERAELREELNRSKAEVLRLRDLLIGKDAELGVLRGRLAELEAGVGRLLNLAGHLRARTPRFIWSAGARLRKRRSSPQG